MLLMLLHEARVANEARVIRSGSRWNMGMGAVYSKFDLDASDWTVLFRSRESLWTVQALGIRHQALGKTKAKAVARRQRGSKTERMRTKKGRRSRL